MKPTDGSEQQSSDRQSSVSDGDRGHLLQARDLALGGLFGALGITAPMLFHAVGLGKVFMPMYLPILALGLLVSWQVALVVGCATPLLSAILTGMPPLAPPIAGLMACELGALAMVASLVRAHGLGVWPATVAAVIASRVVGVVGLITLGRLLGLSQGVWEYAIISVLLSWPGIALQFTVVPGAVYAIERASILGPRWQRS